MREQFATEEERDVQIIEAERNNGFTHTFMVLFESYQRGNGRQLDGTQVKVLVEAFNELSGTAMAQEAALDQADEIIEAQRQRIDELETELAEAQEKRRKLWRP